MDNTVEVIDGDNERGVRLGIRCDKCQVLVRVVGLPFYQVCVSDSPKMRHRHSLVQGLMFPRIDPAHAIVCAGREATP